MALFIRLRVEAAAICSLLGAYLLLPSNLQVDVLFLPPIDKMSIATLTTFLLCWVKAPLMPKRPKSILIILLCVGFVFSPLLTSLGNRYELQTAAGSIPGLYPLDGIKYVGRQLITLLPLLIGYRFLSTSYGRRLLLLSVPIAILLYSPLMLLEVRVSPQLHTWVYGYFPHESFAQQYRGGGFRPVVFLTHGLEVALMVSLAVISCLILGRAKARLAKVPATGLAVYFSGLLLLCKSLGPVVYAIALAPVIWFTRPRTWVKFACAILIVITAYPALRTAQLIPVNAITKAADSISADRSGSFQARVRNEEILLARGNEKPLFGWGTWGRNLIYDPYTGKPTSVTDGQWVILFGVWGWFGYISTFLLFTICTLRAHRAIGRDVTNESVTLGGLALLGTVCVLDMLPNASNMVLPFLIAGTLAAAEKANVSNRKQIRTQPPPIGLPASAQ